MTFKIDTALTNEWQSLHDSHEKYEHFALVIKLFSIALTLIIIALAIPKLFALCLLAILWLQEGIWKTFQARASDRIESIEQAIARPQTDNSSIEAFQFYSQWEKNRPTTLMLIICYIKNSLRPTVIFPYLPLMLITLFC